MAIRFLTARWSRLAMFNYAMPEAALVPHLPPGCVPDTSLDGRAYASLVAFDFERTRVLGVPWPGFTTFPEINLRAYVRRGQDRGVVFVREIVPSRLVAAIARLTYNEPYLAAPTRSETRVDGPTMTVAHRVTHMGRESRLRVTADATPCVTTGDRLLEFFKEHRWGFNRSRSGRLLRYEVAHPEWRCHNVQRWVLDWDFGGLYGPAWSGLARRGPDSVLLAEGSPIEVFVWRSLGGATSG